MVSSTSGILSPTWSKHWRWCSLPLGDSAVSPSGSAKGEMAYHITKFLTAIGLLYGKDSPEYEAAGGTRTSEAGK